MPILSQKPDAEGFRAVLASLAQEEWVKRTEKRLWPRFLFHYSDIRNVARVLADGTLYSRSQVETLQHLEVSSGDPGVLRATDTSIKDCVRFYFRPKTPTQFYTEGTRSQQTLSTSRYPDAHCPVPVFLLFDAGSILARADSRFSDGNLASPRARILYRAHEFAALPWTLIYHNSRHAQGDRDIPFHKSAEVLVPDKLSLEELRYVICRSQAEKEALLSLLRRMSAPLWAKYHSITIATQRIDLYFRQHTFVMSARLDATSAAFEFSPDSSSPGPFAARATLRTDAQSREWINSSYIIDPARSTLSLTWKQPLDAYELDLFLDDHLVYAGQYTEEIPF
jgi:hypothetical protein